MFFVEQLDSKTEYVKLQAFAASTQRTRQSQWKKYYSFCETTALDPFPVIPKNVCRFLVYVSESVCYTTLNNYVSALNALSRLRSDFVDLRQDYNITLVLGGLKRIKGDAREPMDPLLPDDLQKIRQHIDFGILEERIVWIILVTAFRTLLRKSHFVLDRDDTHLIRRRDITFHDWGCIILIFSSKTIQFRERCVKVPIMFCKGTLCAASLLQQFLREFPKNPDDFVFSLLFKDKLVPVQYSRALKLLNKWTIQSEIPKKVGFHSLRRGSATYMHKLRIPLTPIQSAGDWQSLSVLDYLTTDFEDKMSIEKLVSSSLY